MNIQSRSNPTRLFPNRAALQHGIERRLWTVNDLEHMVRAGILHEDEHIELIGGQIIVKDPLPDGANTFPWNNDLPDGVHGRIWTAAELEALTRAGIVGDDERVELIGGEIVTMAAKGARHEIVRTKLHMLWARRLPENLMLAFEAPLHLGDNSDPEPDLILFPDSIYVPDVRGQTVLLVVEVADSSLSYDLEIKSLIYSRAGVRENWVIDPNELVTTVHRDPGPERYRDVAVFSRHDVTTPLASPALAVRLADLKLPWDSP